MPQARSGGSRGSRSGSGRRTTRATGSSRSSSSRAKSSASSRAKGGSKSRRSTGARSTSSRTKRSSTARKSTSRAKASSPAEARLDAAAQRLRKLNERIIEASRDAGATTLTSYERALKAIATSIEKGPGSSDIDLVANLATAQAKFIRDLTTTWTKRARKALK